MTRARSVFLRTQESRIMGGSVRDPGLLRAQENRAVEMPNR
jgi:hypothetical protein